MPITFAPIRVATRDGGTDLTVALRKSNAGACSLELSLSSVAQDRVRYIDGDRVIAHYDEANRSWVLERISADRVSDGYKVQVRAISSGGTAAIVRLGCSGDQASAVMGDLRKARFDFLEVAGNKAVFVATE